MQATNADARWQKIVEFWTKTDVWLWFFPGIIVGFVLGIATRADIDHWFADGFWPEALGIAATALIIDRIYRRRTREEYKAQLLRQIHSRSNDFSVDALRQIQDNGWMDLVVEQKKNLRNVQWQNADLRELDLTESNLIQSNLKNIQFWFVSLQYSELNLSNLQNAYLWDTNLQHANLELVDLQNSTLVRSDLQYTNLRNAKLQETCITASNLENAILSSANLSRGSLIGTNMQGAKFEFANLQHASLCQSCLQYANLWETDLSYAKLRETDLSHAELRETNLQHALISRANLQNANLKQTDLRHAKLNRANMKNANLEGVQFDKQTILPDAELVQDKNGKSHYTAKSYWTPETDMTRYTNPEHPEFWQPMWAKTGYSSYKEWSDAGRPEV